MYKLKRQAIYGRNILYEKFEDTKGVIRSYQSKKDRQHNGQQKKYKQWSTKHYTEN